MKRRRRRRSPRAGCRAASSSSAPSARRGAAAVIGARGGDSPLDGCLARDADDARLLARRAPARRHAAAQLAAARESNQVRRGGPRVDRGERSLERRLDDLKRITACGAQAQGAAAARVLVERRGSRAI